MAECETAYRGLQDPLTVAKVIAALEAEIGLRGLTLEISADFAAMNQRKLSLLQERCGPFHDPEVSALRGDRAFWMALVTPGGQTIALQAFRMDIIDVSLADWAPSYTIGLYMRRQELLVPAHTAPPANSIAERLRGRLVYHGELWIDPSHRKQGLAVPFGRLGLLLSLVKWQPAAIWALASQSMAMRGGMMRLGYSHQERGFFRWQMMSGGIDGVEWIAVAERQALEQLAAEIATTPQQYQPA